METTNDITEIDALVQVKDYAAAKIICQRRLAANPKDRDALYLLGTVCLMAGESKSGLTPLFRLIDQNPGHLNGLINLGNCYLNLKNWPKALQCFKKVVSLQPKNIMALNNIGVIFTEEKKHRDAARHYKQALQFAPNDPEIRSNLMCAYWASGQKSLAISMALQLLRAADPGQALFPTFNLLKECCFWKEAAAVLPTLIHKIVHEKTNPNNFEYLNLPLLTCSELDNGTVFEVLKRSGACIEKFRNATPFAHRPAFPAKRWRVAYLSPDFRKHVVDHFIRGLVLHHDREQFEIFCYSNTSAEDEVTAQYQQNADHFIDIRRMNDWEAAERIHQDGIHFLIDLAGFTEGGRLPVLRYRPAPIQMMYLGYPYTSGLKTVDYFVSDPYLEGPGNASHFTENLINLPASFISFSRPEITGMLDEPPCIQKQWLTFGSLSKPCKLNPKVIAVWSEILEALPNSKLILNHPEYDFEVTRSNILKIFLEHGIDSKHILFIWNSHPSGNFLQYYNEIDIVLDAFPATGGTTTIDALQMGKPVVTLVGNLNYERLSYSILKNVGLELEDLIAFNERDYVDKAVGLAKNSERVIALHRQIPEALKTSILCDPPRFTRQMEELYLEAWQKKYDFIPVSKNPMPTLQSVSI